MALDDPLADGQADAGARVMLAGVEALKELEDALEILRLDADALVPDREYPALRLPADADMDLGRLARRGT